jgi:hypothetical protein
MIVNWILTALLALGFVWGLGNLVQGNRQGSGVSASPFTDGSDCETARLEYIRTAGQACALTATADAATSARVGIERELVSAQIVAAGLLVGAVAAGLIPILGKFLGPVLMNAYVGAQSYVVFLLGRLHSAAQAESRAKGEWARAWQAFNSAQIMLHRRCPRDVAESTEASTMRCQP